MRLARQGGQAHERATDLQAKFAVSRAQRSCHLHNETLCQRYSHTMVAQRAAMLLLERSGTGRPHRQSQGYPAQIRSGSGSRWAAASTAKPADSTYAKLPLQEARRATPTCALEAGNTRPMNAVHREQALISQPFAVLACRSSGAGTQLGALPWNPLWCEPGHRCAGWLPVTPTAPLATRGEPARARGTGSCALVATAAVRPTSGCPR